MNTAIIEDDATSMKLARRGVQKWFQRLSVGRELQMIELKKEVNELAKLAGRTAPYDLSFLGTGASKPRADHD